MIERGIALAALGSGLALCPPLLCAHEAAFHGADLLVAVVSYLSGVEYVLGAAAVGLLAGQRGRNTVTLSFVALGAGLVAGAVASGYTVTIPHVGITNLGAATTFGVLVALNLPLHPPVVAGLALVLGLAQGYANGLAIRIDRSEVLFITGTVGASDTILALASALATGGPCSGLPCERRAVGLPQSD